MTTLPQTQPMRSARPFATQQLALPGPVQGSLTPPPTGMSGADIWRVVRANLWLILIALLVSGAGGYAINTWLARYHSRYSSTGLLKINGSHDAMDIDGRSDTSGLEVEQQTQVNLLLHERLLSSILEQSDAIRQTDWFKQFIYYKNGQPVVNAEAARTDLMQHLEVAPIGTSRLIKVRMSYSIPKDCQTIVREVCDRHINEQRAQVDASEIEKANALEQLKLNYEAQIRDMTVRMSRLATDLGAAGVGINVSGSSKEYELSSLISEQLRAQAFVGAAKAKLNTFNQQMETNSAPELEEALQRAPLYAEYRRQVDDLELAYADISAQLGTSNVRSVSLKRRLEQVQQKLSDTENDVKSRTAELMRGNLSNDLTAAEQAVSRISDRLDVIRRDIADLAQKRNEYEHLQAELNDRRAKLDHVVDQQDKIGYLMGRGKWAMIDWATLPDLPDHPTFPKLFVTLPLALMVGLALSLGVSFLREMTDTSVRTPRDIARVGHLTLLGMIPHESDDPQAAGARLPLAIFEAPHSIIAEQFRQLRTRLQHTASLDTTRSILITGCSAEDGVTTVAINLAAGLALNGRRILLVDANFRRPNLQNIFQQTTETGFGDVLNDLDLFVDALHETEVPNLSVIMAGAKPSNPTELLESQLLIDFIERALEEYDHVIFDSGPLLMVSDSIALAPRVDGVMTVVRARGNSRGMLSRMRDELRRLKAEHLGVVLNAVRVHGGGYYAMMIKNYYAYQNS